MMIAREEYSILEYDIKSANCYQLVEEFLSIWYHCNQAGTNSVEHFTSR